MYSEIADWVSVNEGKCINIHSFICTLRRPRFDLVPGSMYQHAVNITRCHFIAREFRMADINIIQTRRLEEVIYQDKLLHP